MQKNHWLTYSLYALLKAGSSIILIFFLGLASSVVAAEDNVHVMNPPTSQAQIDADTMQYDRQHEVVSAKGKVQVVYQEKILHADTLTYYLKEDRVVAEGNVQLQEPDGTISYANTMELSDKLSRGIADHFRSKMATGAYLAAKEAVRQDPKHLLLEDAQYSACGPCQTKAGEPTLPWQFNAKKANVDLEKERITYKNMWMKAMGMPVFFTPYFSHPTPNAQPKTGFLLPSYGSNTELGKNLTVPLYLRVAPHIDATITPTFYSKENPLLRGEYRQLFHSGTLNVTGSFIVPKTTPLEYRYTMPHVRGHIFAEGKHKSNSDWVSGFSLRRSSDPTYLKKFHFSDEIYLQSELFTHRYQEHQFFSLRGLDFQGLRSTDVSTEMPLALPLVHSRLESDPFSADDARLAWDNRVMMVTRTDGPDARRILQHFTWQKSFTTPQGVLLDWTNGLRLDGYDVDTVPLNSPPGPKNPYNGSKGHALPFTQLDARLPFIKQGQRQYIVLEPLASVYSSPTVHYTQKIPNQDTTLVELTPENLFQASRFLGYDLIEGGTRVSYGVRSASYHHDGYGGSIMVGQHYHKRNGDLYQRGSGMEGPLSDYLMQFHLKPLHYLDILHRIRLDRKRGNIRGNQTTAIFNFYPIVYNIAYTALDDERQNTRNVKYLSNSVRAVLKKGWEAEAGSEFNFGQRQLTQKKLVKFFGKLLYTHHCYRLMAVYEQTFIRDRDVRPQSYLGFSLSLQTL